MKKLQKLLISLLFSSMLSLSIAQPCYGMHQDNTIPLEGKSAKQKILCYKNIFQKINIANPTHRTLASLFTTGACLTIAKYLPARYSLLRTGAYALATIAGGSTVYNGYKAIKQKDKNSEQGSSGNLENIGDPAFGNTDPNAPKSPQPTAVDKQEENQDNKPVYSVPEGFNWDTEDVEATSRSTITQYMHRFSEDFQAPEWGQETLTSCINKLLKKNINIYYFSDDHKPLQYSFTQDSIVFPICSAGENRSQFAYCLLQEKLGNFIDLQLPHGAKNAPYHDNMFCTYKLILDETGNELICHVDGKQISKHNKFGSTDQNTAVQDLMPYRDDDMAAAHRYFLDNVYTIKDPTKRYVYIVFSNNIDIVAREIEFANRSQTNLSNIDIIVLDYGDFIAHPENLNPSANNHPAAHSSEAYAAFQPLIEQHFNFPQQTNTASPYNDPVDPQSEQNNDSDEADQTKQDWKTELQNHPDVRLTRMRRSPSLADNIQILEQKGTHIYYFGTNTANKFTFQAGDEVDTICSAGQNRSQTMRLLLQDACSRYLIPQINLRYSHGTELAPYGSTEYQEWLMGMTLGIPGTEIYDNQNNLVSLQLESAYIPNNENPVPKEPRFGTYPDQQGNLRHPTTDYILRNFAQLRPDVFGGKLLCFDYPRYFQIQNKELEEHITTWYRDNYYKVNNDELRRVVIVFKNIDIVINEIIEANKDKEILSNLHIIVLDYGDEINHPQPPITSKSSKEAYQAFGRKLARHFAGLEYYMQA
jgi:hypothetical protein